MQFLLDMNVPPSLGRNLISRGQKARHVKEIGMSRSDDLEIISEARKNTEIIITHDLDYGHLLAFSGEATPSVIIFRLRNTHPNNLFSQLIEKWPEIENPLLEGAIVVIEDNACRIRRLPISKR
jgi:predicted nuclease of predicted toxin-antitoxin system